MISHNTDFVKEVSNRTLLMEDGKIVDDVKMLIKLLITLLTYVMLTI